MQAHEDEPHGHHDDVGGVGLAEEVWGFPPESHDDEDHGERENLPEFDPDIECQQVREQAVLGNPVFQYFRGQAGAVEWTSIS